MRSKSGDFAQQSAEKGGKVDDAVESVNKFMEAADAINNENNNTTENKSATSYTIDLWKDDSPYGDAGVFVGEEAANKFIEEYKKQNPGMDATKREYGTPHPNDNNIIIE